MGDVPSGFRISRRSSPFLDLIGPVYADDRSGVLALRARPELLNARGFLHAGVLLGLADVALGRSITPPTEGEVSAVTASLTTDFLGKVREGDWLEARASVRRTGRRLGFAHAVLTVDDQPVAQSSGVFSLAGRSGQPAEQGGGPDH